MTEVVKINPLASNFKSMFGRLYRKFKNSNSDITVIVKPKMSKKDAIEDGQQFNDQKSNRQLQQFEDQLYQSNFSPESMAKVSDFSEAAKKRSENDIVSRNKMRKKSDSLSECLTNREEFEIGGDYNVFISNKNILPDVIITHNCKKKSTGNSASKINHQLTVPQQKKSNKSIAKRNKQNSSEIQQKTQKQFNFKQNSSPQLSDHPYPPRLVQPLKSSYQDSETQKSQQSDRSVVQSLFIIEDQLNDAIQFIKENKLFQLEEYLYEFKAKYNTMTNRVQIKWRLLMAYCKQNRKQYERASILYQQVLQMAKSSPKSLLVNPAEINHRLGICYTEIRRWNDGILCFANALKQYKVADNKIKYAECMNNLGTLYLSAYQIEPAQQCFLISYELKQNEYTSNSKKLISCLFNLFECNISNHNFQQAQKVLAQVTIILVHLKQSEMITAGLYRRKGKLAFLKGDMENARNNFQKAKQILEQKYPYSLEYGQLCNNLGILYLDQGIANEARDMLSLALSRLVFYQTKDSVAIQKIKRNLELVNKIGAEKQEQEVRGEKVSKGEVRQYDRIKQD